jgi:hypothetical protein
MIYTWWKIHQGEFSGLAQLARDVFGIPSMSAEVERLFSSAKLMLPPYRSALLLESIEAGECIRSWVGAGLFFGDYFEYLSPDGKLEEHFRLQSVPPLARSIFRNILQSDPCYNDPPYSDILIIAIFLLSLINSIYKY